MKSDVVINYELIEEVYSLSKQILTLKEEGIEYDISKLSILKKITDLNKKINIPQKTTLFEKTNDLYLDFNSLVGSPTKIQKDKDFINTFSYIRLNDLKKVCILFILMKRNLEKMKVLDYFEEFSNSYNNIKYISKLNLDDLIEGVKINQADVNNTEIEKFNEVYKLKEEENQFSYIELVEILKEEEKKSIKLKR